MSTMASSPVPTLSGGARTRLRLTRRGRTVVTMLAALPLIIGAVVFALNGGDAVATGEQMHVGFQQVTVKFGDSLWTVAERIAPSADPRTVIVDLVRFNNLDASGIVSPGQQLAIPTKYER